MLMNSFSAQLLFLCLGHRVITCHLLADPSPSPSSDDVIYEQSLISISRFSNQICLLSLVVQFVTVLTTIIIIITIIKGSYGKYESLSKWRLHLGRFRPSSPSRVLCKPLRLQVKLQSKAFRQMMNCHHKNCYGCNRG